MLLTLGTYQDGLVFILLEPLREATYLVLKQLSHVHMVGNNHGQWVSR